LAGQRPQQAQHVVLVDGPRCPPLLPCCCVHNRPRFDLVR
jgi:hypothetical protein